MRILRAEWNTRARRVSFLAPDVRSNLTILDETPKQPRVDVGEYPLRDPAVDLGTSIMRQIEGEAYETCTIFKHMAL